MLVHHEFNAGTGCPFLARLRQKDDVAIQLCPAAFEKQHDHEIGGQLVLVVDGAASPNVAVFEDGAEGIYRPFVALDSDHVGVGHQEHRAFSPVSFETGYEICARRVEREYLRRNTLVVEDLLQVFDSEGFIAWRVAGVDLYQRPVVAKSFRLVGLPVDGGDLG